LPTSSRRLARAQLADLFVGPARNVMIFFSDLLGLHHVYKPSGSVSDRTGSLRVPPDFMERHARSVREGTALDLPAALAAAFAPGASRCCLALRLATGAGQTRWPRPIKADLKPTWNIPVVQT